MLDETNIDKHAEREVEEQIAELRDEIENIVDTIKNFNIDGVKSKVSDIYTDAKSRGRESYYEAREKLGDMQEHICEEVRENPMQSISIAIGIGFILGLFCRR